MEGPVQHGRPGGYAHGRFPVRGACRRALALYREAAAIGYAPAALKAAELLQNGKGGELDADEAYRLLRRVVDATGNPKGMYMLAQLYYARGDEAQGDSLMKASAQAAYLPAMNRMARPASAPGQFPGLESCTVLLLLEPGRRIGRRRGGIRRILASVGQFGGAFPGDFPRGLAFSPFCRQEACRTAKAGTGWER